jgi:hypothetical protein
MARHVSRGVQFHEAGQREARHVGPEGTPGFELLRIPEQLKQAPSPLPSPSQCAQASPPPG